MTNIELGRLLNLPASTAGRLKRQGHIRYEDGEWTLERPPAGRKKGDYGKGLKAEKGK